MLRFFKVFNLFFVFLTALTKVNAIKHMDPHLAIKEWHYFQDSNVTESFDDLYGFIKKYSDVFPVESIKLRLEEAAYKKKQNPQKIIKYFSFFNIKSAKGLCVLLEAYLATNNQKKMKEVFYNNWLKLSFDKKTFNRLIDLVGSFITQDDYVQKANILVVNEKIDELKILTNFLKGDFKNILNDCLLIEQEANTFKKEKMIAQSLKKYGNKNIFIYTALKFYTKQKQDDKAISLLKKIDPLQESLNPEAWFKKRHILAIRRMEKGKWKDALLILKGNKLKSGTQFADANWRIAWLELTKFDNFKGALKIFESLYEKVSMPISKSRMAFWTAKTLEVMNDKENAIRFYKYSAKYLSTFYGRMSVFHLQKLGVDTSKMQLTLDVGVNEKVIEKFNNRFIVKALKVYGDKMPQDLIFSLLDFLSQQIDIIGEEVLITDLAYDLCGNFGAVYISKKAQFLDPVVNKKAYPILDSSILKHVFKAKSEILKAISHGIIRQESNFHDSAISDAKAKGLMQLIDKTAQAMKKVAKRFGINVSNTNVFDVKTNVGYGTAHILELLEQYDGYLVLALCAYNAGPSNVQEWVNDFGDPRKHKAWIDWIDSIPFGETRNYVQRVVENIAVYEVLFDVKNSFDVKDLIAKPIIIG